MPSICRLNGLNQFFRHIDSGGGGEFPPTGDGVHFDDLTCSIRSGMKIDSSGDGPNCFGGSPGNLVLSALALRKSTPEELRQIREILDRRERGEA